MSADIGQSVRERLASIDNVTNLVGERIYADVLEQSATLPAIVVQVPGGGAPVEFLNSSERKFRSIVTVQAYGTDRKQANALAKIIRDEALPADLRGSVNGAAIGEVSLVSDPAELVDEPKDGSDRFRRLTQQTFSIWWQPI